MDLEDDKPKRARTIIYSSVLSLLLFLMLVVVSIWIILNLLGSHIQNDIRYNLTSVIEATNNATSAWIANKFGDMQLLAQNPKLTNPINLLLNGNLIDTNTRNTELKKIRNLLSPWMIKHDANDFFFLSPDGRCIASMHSGKDERIKLAEVRHSLFESSFKGQQDFILPFRSNAEEKQPMMFFSIPIYDSTGKIQAVFVISINPLAGFSGMAESIRPGETGELYFFNKDGFLISESRFEKELQLAGILTATQKSLLNIRLVVPTQYLNKEQVLSAPVSNLPLTKMAQLALSGKSGVELNPYQGYRGTSVVGAWNWNAEFDFGLAYEIDEAQAYHSYSLIKNTIFITLLFLTVIYCIALYVFSRGKFKDIKAARIMANNEQQIKLSNARLHEAQEIAHLGHWEFDISSGSIVWSDEAYRIFGLKPQEIPLTYDIFMDAVHPDDRDMVYKTYQDSVANKTKYNIEYRIVLNDGAIKHIKEKGCTEFDEGGNPVRFLGIVHDISNIVETQRSLQEFNHQLESKIYERTAELQKSTKAALSIMQDANQSKKLAEDALNKLRKSQSELIKLSKAIEASPVSVVVTDADGIIEYINPKFTDVSGYTAEESIGQNLQDLQYGGIQTNSHKTIWKTLKQGKEWHGELRNIHKDGTLLWESSSISPIRNDDGMITNFVAVKEDITEKKHAEEELHKALIKAEEATKAKSEFLANMSHEIRTPMNAVIGMTHLALDTTLTPRQKDYLHKIEISAKSLLGIINDILDFSKIEAGKLIIEQTAFNLQEVIDDIVVLSLDKLSDKEVELLIDIDRNIPDILLGDPVRIGQIFNNLLSNAVKFTEKGEIDISVNILKQQEKTITLECAVSDTGLGMTTEQSSNLFQKFSQADQTITRKYGGTGLGLAICRQLVDLMQGDIKVTSEYGKGSRFIFTLEFEYKKDTIKNKEPHLLPLNLRDLKVLLVDSNTKSVEINKGLLKSLSFEVDVSLNCDDALQMFESAVSAKLPYELIIIDYKLMLDEGCTPDEKIKKLDDAYSTPIIIMAKTKEVPKAEDLMKNRQLSSVIIKPCTSSSLFNAIGEAFGYSEVKVESRRKASQDLLNNLVCLSGSKILLAEDNRVNQQIACELLQKVNAEIIIANNGMEAVEIAKQQQFDLILMDIQMPVMDGITATFKIRRLESENNCIPIVAMTAHAMKGDREISLMAGMNDHITKPIDPKELYACIVNWIKPKDKKAILSASFDNKQSSANVEELNFPKQISGIDIDAGLLRIMGNKKLYLNILEEFYNESKTLPEQVSKALAIDDYKTAERLVHTMKAVAGNIGAKSLYKKAQLIEDCFEDETKTIQSLLDLTWKDLQDILNNIEQALPSRQKSESPNGSISEELHDFEVVPSKFNELQKLLRIGDTVSVDIFHEIRGSLFSLNPDLTIKLDKAIDSFDFKKALGIIKDINPTG